MAQLSARRELAEFLCLPAMPPSGPLADFLYGELRNASSATEHRDVTRRGVPPYNGRYFVTTCCCGARFLGRDADEADFDVADHVRGD